MACAAARLRMARPTTIRIGTDCGSVASDLTVPAIGTARVSVGAQPVVPLERAFKLSTVPADCGIAAVGGKAGEVVCAHEAVTMAAAAEQASKKIFFMGTLLECP